jgi:hypothetical protein
MSIPPLKNITKTAVKALPQVKINLPKVNLDPINDLLSKEVNLDLGRVKDFLSKEINPKYESYAIKGIIAGTRGVAEVILLLVALQLTDAAKGVYQFLKEIEQHRVPMNQSASSNIDSNGSSTYTINPAIDKIITHHSQDQTPKFPPKPHL